MKSLELCSILSAVCVAPQMLREFVSAECTSEGSFPDNASVAPVEQNPDRCSAHVPDKDPLQASGGVRGNTFMYSLTDRGSSLS